MSELKDLSLHETLVEMHRYLNEMVTRIPNETVYDYDISEHTKFGCDIYGWWAYLNDHQIMGTFQLVQFLELQNGNEYLIKRLRQISDKVDGDLYYDMQTIKPHQAKVPAPLTYQQMVNRLK